jgi:hypothetical protein
MTSVLTKFACGTISQRFHFRSPPLNFVVPENNQYAYRLGRTSKMWMGTERRASYTNLQPGEYLPRKPPTTNNRPANYLNRDFTPFWLPGGFGYCCCRWCMGFAFSFRRKLELKAFEERKRKRTSTSVFTNITNSTPLSLILGPLERIRTINAV